MQTLWTFLSGAAGAALIAGIFSLVQYKLRKKDELAAGEKAERKALRYLMLYIIEERCKDFIAAGEISLDELRRLHHWHEVYHDGLGGNGDADKLLERVESLKIITD